jgi:hypothetical protein
MSSYYKKKNKVARRTLIYLWPLLRVYHRTVFYDAANIAYDKGNENRLFWKLPIDSFVLLQVCALLCLFEN